MFLYQIRHSFVLPLAGRYKSESSNPLTAEVYIAREVNLKSPELSAYVSDLDRMEV